jgi:erythromycin esterase-like protein
MEKRAMLSQYSPEDVAVVAEHARNLSGTPNDYEPLMELIGDARLVLLGQASRGTHEFFAARARITRRLIEEKGFTAVALESDWTDCMPINSFVRGAHDNHDALAALDGFTRFPTWIWRNGAVLDFIEWLRAHNQFAQGEPPVGFHGVDLYNMHASNECVLSYLDTVDPAAAERARRRFAHAGFDDFGDEALAHHDPADSGFEQARDDELVGELLELRRRAAVQVSVGGRMAEDESFAIEQDESLARNAEDYYRLMYGGSASAWGLRTHHLAQMISALVDHLDRSVGRGKVVFWAHNSQVGDARANELGDRCEVSVGQLARERFGEDAVLVGMTTYQWTVRAASDWDSPLEHKIVVPAEPGSYEALFHEIGQPRFYLPLRGCPAAAQVLRAPRLQRAIGVYYRPETERLSHYLQARLSDQFDAVIHIDQTTAVHPMRGDPAYEEEELPKVASACA